MGDDDLASSGMLILAEASQRGVVHGHGQTTSVPKGVTRAPRTDCAASSRAMEDDKPADKHRQCSSRATAPEPMETRQGEVRTSPQIAGATDIFGEAAVTLPKACPVARPGLALRAERLERPELRDAYAQYIQSQQQAHGLPVLPPCTRCGQPTGMWCDFCTGQGPAKAVCSECCDELTEDICRICAARRH